MQRQLLTELKTNSDVSAETLVDSLTMLPVTLRAEYQGYMSTNLSALEDANNIRRVFHLLSPLLTFIDYKLLEFLIEEFASYRLKRDMGMYVQDIEVFIDETTIKHLTKVWPGRQKIPPDFTKLTTVIDKDPATYTLRELNELRRKFCCETSLTETILILIGVGEKNSFLVAWIVPSSCVPKLKSVVRKSKRLKIYQEEKITSITLGTRQLYSITSQLKENLVTLCRKRTGSISEFQYLLSQPGLDPNLYHKDGHTLLSLASSQGRTDLVKLFLDHGADVGLPDNNQWGNTALIRACTAGHVATAGLLINKGATINYLTKKGHHALGAASFAGRLDCVKLLLHYKARIDLPFGGDLGFTALMCACQEGHTEVVDVLIEKGARVEYHNKIGATPLIKACENGHYDVVQLLLHRGAHVDHPAKEEYCRTPLMFASLCGCSMVVMTLINMGAKVNFQIKTGWTSLHYACYKGHTEVAEILIKNGAQLGLTSKDGDTPLRLAKRCGHNDIVKILKGVNSKVVGELGVEDGLLASEKDNSRSGKSPVLVQVLSKLAKKVKLMRSIEGSPHQPKQVNPPGPVLTLTPKESRTCGEEASPGSPYEINAGTEIEYDFVEQPHKDFFCPVTFELLLNPQQTLCCGNFLSERAANRLKQEKKPCPICKEPDLATMLDKNHKRRVREVQVYCFHKAGGCGWVGEVGGLQSHLNSCLNRSDASFSGTASLPAELC